MTKGKTDAEPTADDHRDDAGRLTADQALAQLDRAPADLLRVEAAHGFTFGNPDEETGTGKPVAVVQCTVPTCPQRKQQMQIHDDTLLPVYCGGCHGVLYCDHQPETTTVRDGTLGAPLEHTITACTVCRKELARDTVALPPIDLASLPIGILDAPA